MGLTKRKDGWYVEFPVLDDGKVFTLARGTPGARIKRWKTGSSNKTVAKQQEAKIKTDLMMGLVKSESSRCITFAEWGETYLGLEGVRALRSYKERVHAVRLQLIPFLAKSLSMRYKPKMSRPTEHNGGCEMGTCQAWEPSITTTLS